ncbi:scavenger receptor class B member 1-like [Coccinella septempunctata]|uniref:scavenger receptor class B member 1-like n=1 Tax=Coccinella septempunctata TaxID=41139 RepID=UPI001D0651E4|nr:scavenger receptor class B member 1-like [Coccinella septempunctata]
MELPYKLNTKILLLALMGVIMVICSYFMFVYEPISLIIKKLLSLETGTLFFYLWQDPPYKIYINVNIFSVTNQEKFTRGEEKLALQEVGPYCFQEILLNTNVTFHPNGTVSYVPVRSLKFIRERSVGDINIDRVVSPNIPLVGISAMLRDSSMFTNLALTMISNTANSKSFVNVTVHDYLFGYDDLLVKLANTALPTWINFDKFGILDRIMALENASNIVTITSDHVLAKPTNPLYAAEDLKRDFYIQEYNGSPGLRQWGYEDTEGNETCSSNSKCNFIGGGFDGTLFPRDLTLDQGMLLYRRAFCRPVPAVPVREVIMNGYEGVEYAVKKDFLYEPSANPDNACYCKEEGDCLPRGIVSIAPCYYDIPITLSQPHFYNADPSLLEQVTGLLPNRSKHDVNFTLHKQLGLPIQANLRIQVNLDVGETKYNAKTTIFNNLHLPLCWLELQVDEVPLLVNVLITLAFVLAPISAVILKYCLVIFGAAMISCSALLMLSSSEIVAENNLEALPFSRFSLRRSSEYKPIPVSSPQQYLRQNMRRISK